MRDCACWYRFDAVARPRPQARFAWPCDPRATSGASLRVLRRSWAGALARLDESRLVREYDSLNPVAEAELGEDVREVGLHGCFCEEEGGGDFAVGEAAGDENEDVELTIRQSFEFGGLRGTGWGAADELLDESASDRGGEERVAGGYGSDSIREVPPAERP